MTAVENKIPNVSGLVKKTDYNTKFSETEKKVSHHNHDKYITTLKFNFLAARVFNARLAQARLVIKTDYKVLVKGLPQIKQGICLSKMNLKNYKNLIQAILEVKVILKKMAHKII